MASPHTVLELLLRRKDVLEKRALAVAAYDQELSAIEEELLVAAKADASAGEPKQAGANRPPAGGDKLLEMIASAKGNKLDYGTCAEALFGADNERNRHRVINALHHLKKKGKISYLGVGRWEIA